MHSTAVQPVAATIADYYEQIRAHCWWSIIQGSSICKLDIVDLNGNVCVSHLYLWVKHTVTLVAGIVQYTVLIACLALEVRIAGDTSIWASGISLVVIQSIIVSSSIVVGSSVSEIHESTKLSINVSVVKYPISIVGASCIKGYIVDSQVKIMIVISIYPIRCDVLHNDFNCLDGFPLVLA